MGGSAIGGRLARAVLGDHASRPILSSRAYGLPPWTTPDVTVLCASYSGDTEETLACYEAAGALGAPRVVVTTGGQLAELARRDGVPVIPVAGGLQPRCAVAYMTVAALEVAARCGAGPRMNARDRRRRRPPRAAGRRVGARRRRGLAGQGAGARTARVDPGHRAAPGPRSPIAYRWKTQINENAKIPAMAHELPEFDHNEIVGWAGAPDLGRLSAVFLEDSDTHPRIERRVELTERLIAPARGRHPPRRSRAATTCIERVFSLVLLGDLVSLYLAVLRGVDPTPVAVIDELKASLAAED